ncbi:DUF4190 domain-containing protein [Rothia nasimurium]|uniref:DUF4190 domain-containing protein n=1 Tax=Rothia nasimurium TaxID=85336 RepID=UPI003B9DF210
MTQPQYPSNPHFQQVPQHLPEQGGAATGLLIPPPSPYDTDTPGEPASYIIPDGHRRPFGVNVRDKRGRGYYLAVMSLAAAVSSVIVVALGGILSLAALIPALGAIVLGIKALGKLRTFPSTRFDGATKGFAWGGISLGLICAPLAIVMFLFMSWFMDVAETANCEYAHAGDEEAIAQCIEDNTSSDF